MRNLGRTFVAFGLAALLAAPASAQQPPRPGGGGFGGGFGGGGRGGATALLQNKSVQEELKVTEDQLKKIEEVNKKVGELYTEKTKDLSREDRFNREKMAPIMAAVNAESDKLLADALTSEQIKRFKQIRLQQEGTRAFTTEEVAKALNLEEEQKKKITEINETLNTEVRGLFRERDGQTKIAEKRKEAMGKIAATLTSEQKKSWKEMTGEPFEVKFERRPGGPGGRPGQPGGRPGQPGGRPGQPGQPQPRPRTDL